MEFACKKAWNLDCFSIVKETYVQSCKNVPTSQDNSKEKVVALRSDCEHENREFVVDSGASLRKMSQNEIASGEKDTIRRSKELTVITTASGKAESTEAPTAYVNIHQQCYLWVYYSKEKATPMNGKGRVPIIDYRLKSDKVQD